MKKMVKSLRNKTLKKLLSSQTGLNKKVKKAYFTLLTTFRATMTLPFSIPESIKKLFLRQNKPKKGKIKSSSGFT